MKFIMKILQINTGAEWDEEMEKDCKDAQKEAEEIMAFFNRTLREGESPRKLIKVTVIDDHSIDAHDWQKTNLMTKMDHTGAYDTYACSRCYVTGKRFGLSPAIDIDKKYKAKKWQRCDTAMAAREK